MNNKDCISKIFDIYREKDDTKYYHVFLVPKNDSVTKKVVEVKYENDSNNVICCESEVKKQCFDTSAYYEITFEEIANGSFVSAICNYINSK